MTGDNIILAVLNYCFKKKIDFLLMIYNYHLYSVLNLHTTFQRSKFLILATEERNL